MDIIGLLCKPKGFRETNKGRALPHSKFEQAAVFAPQVPDTRVRQAVSLRRMGPYGATRIDSDHQCPLLSFILFTCPTHTDRPSFIYSRTVLLV